MRSTYSSVYKYIQTRTPKCMRIDTLKMYTRPAYITYTDTSYVHRPSTHTYHFVVGDKLAALGLGVLGVDELEREPALLRGRQHGELRLFQHLRVNNVSQSR